MTHTIPKLLQAVLLIISITTAAKAQVKVNGITYTIEQCADKANELEKDGSLRDATSFLNAAAYFLWENKDYDKAIELYRRSMTLNKQLNNINAIAGIESNLGMIYADKGDYLTSLSYMQKTLDARELENEKARIINAKINVAVVLNKLLRHDEAIVQLNEALKYASDINDKNNTRVCYGMLAETYELKGDRKAMLQYFEYYKATVDNLQKDKEQKLQSAFDKIQHDIELTQSEKENREVQLKLKEKELFEKQSELNRYESANKELLQKATEIELQLAVLAKEEELNTLLRQKTERELAHERKMNLFILAALVIAIIFSVYVAATLRRNQRLNRMLKERNDTISKQKQRLVEENKIRTKLLSILSHDLRTPLNGIHLLVQILRSGSLPKETFERQLVKLDESLNCTFQMLENMLYWAKNQMNGIVYSPENIDLAIITAEALKIAGTHLHDKNIDVDNRLYTAEVYADKEMVSIIVRNLIVNAVKYTPQDGKITISSKMQNDMLIWSIADTGNGMSDELKAKIFTTDVKSSKGTNMETGSGLGLALCHDFAVACKGNIDFESEFGKGTTFRLALPAETAPRNFNILSKHGEQKHFSANL
ncbi:MAG: tetratricopeptide repeat protein [Prevotellaceae bacterium]|jgi:signal transduction histidine kinase|nr:tetratricopeptide repeat protein [Prevotellaceae bacterium]